MRKATSILFLWAAMILAATAADPVAATSAHSPAAQWALESRMWENLLTGQSTSPTSLRLGRSDFTLSGPLVQSFRPRPRFDDRCLGQKILDFPVVNMFVPQPMPVPPGGIGPSYLAWGSERHVPWAAVAAGGPAGIAPSSREAQASAGLISIHW